MTTWIAIAALLAASAGQQPARKPVRPRAASALIGLPSPAAGGGSTDIVASVSPAAITFNTNDPDTGMALGSSAATLTWIYNGNHKVPWNVTVQASSDTFDNCPTIPASAVTVTCTSISVTKNGRGTCAPPAPLSTSPVPITSGTESNPTATYTIILSFTLADNWQRIAQLTPSCSLTLTYTATVP
jgi:hypothetical protein